jgi:hypothetical protein
LLQRLERWKGICVMCRSRNQTGKERHRQAFSQTCQSRHEVFE